MVGPRTTANQHVPVSGRRLCRDIEKYPGWRAETAARYCFGVWRRLVCTLAALPAIVGCRPLDLGTDIIWSADFETGDLSQWSQGPGTGGAFVADAGPSDAAVVASTDHAHSGRYSAKFTSVANMLPTSRYPINGGGLYKQAAFPAEAYYSAWYYIPGPYQTPADWQILRVVVAPSGSAAGDAAAGAAPGMDASADAGDAGAGDDQSASLAVSLRYLPPKLTLVVTDVRRPYLESPLPEFVPAVPIQQWFQIEVFFRNLDDAAGGGRFSLWLDGTQIYDIPRSFGFDPSVYFSPCSLAADLQPPLAILYVDDVAVSWSRVSPTGILHDPP